MRDTGSEAGIAGIGEASDGLAAVKKAWDLQPNLILLDIGLPTLNGIEAAHRISRLVPRAIILFVSQNGDPDVVAAALSNGAKGYVRTQKANTELLHAVETVLRGDPLYQSAFGGKDAGGWGKNGATLRCRSCKCQSFVIPFPSTSKKYRSFFQNFLG